MLRDYTAQIISVTDAAGEPVECKVKVKGTRDQKDSYTVNLFLTTASALINGKALDGTFEKKHLPQIASKLNISENGCKTEQTLQLVTDMLAEVVAGNAQSATESSLSTEDQATKSPGTESSTPALTDETRELVEVSGNKQSATESSLSTEDQAPGTESSTPAQTDENREPVTETESNTEQNTNHGADNSATQDPEVDFPRTRPHTEDSTPTSKSTTDIAEILATVQALENKYTELLTHQDTMRNEITTLKTELAAEQEKNKSMQDVRNDLNGLKNELVAEQTNTKSLQELINNMVTREELDALKQEFMMEQAKAMSLQELVNNLELPTLPGYETPKRSGPIRKNQSHISVPTRNKFSPLSSTENTQTRTVSGEQTQGHSSARASEPSQTDSDEKSSDDKSSDDESEEESEVEDSEEEETKIKESEEEPVEDTGRAHGSKTAESDKPKEKEEDTTEEGTEIKGHGKEAENQETNESQENQRSTVRKQAKSNKIDHIMIVDSMARYLDPDRLYKSKKTIIRKLKNRKVKAAVGAAEELLELKPTAVTLVLGTEELQKGSAASVITDMKEVIAVIKKVFPHSTVLISEVMPYPSPKNLQRKAEYVNKALGIWKNLWSG